ncbi:MAG: ubiquinone/menaquinone biosynthesis methyltransferase [Lentisphaeraceae bacterium]|nr:ubiquinone/menaquinone biosynthesis methyltransferase [Lentisphaeraceae bacterium]
MSKLDNITKESRLEWEKGISGMFQEIADSYEKINTFISMGMDQGWRRSQLKRLEQYLKDAPVLDIGCGPGSLSALAKKELPQARFLSTDISPRFLEIAANSGNADVLAQVSASDLPFKDDSFAAIVSAFVLRNLPDLKRFYKECHRTLKKDGIVCMLDLTTPAFKPISFFHSIYMKMALPLGAKIYGSRVEAYKYLDRSIKNCYSQKEMNSILEECGFKVLHTDKKCMGTVTIYTAQVIK